MNPHISVITLGVDDLARARQFYSEGLGWPIQTDEAVFVAFRPAGGSSAVALYPRDALARDAGAAAPAGSDYHGFMFSYIVPTDERVDAVMSEAERAGGSIVKPALRAPWGGYAGIFADPDGYLWKVVAGRYEAHGALRETEQAYSE